MSLSKDNLPIPSSISRGMTQKLTLVASSPSSVIPHKALKHVLPLKKLRGKHTDQIIGFLLKLAALEAVRRLSKARCPVVWRVIQALQVLACPPLKWIQRWGPLRAIVMAVQKFSRPLLCLSIATAFFDHSEISERTENRVDESRLDSESPNEPSTSDTRKSDQSDDTSKNIVSENWLEKIRKELEKEGISLPERIDENELRRFYTATKGDHSCLLSSLKRTIRWRETYYLLTSHELENWSALVFWHGFDVMLRPCLVIRLGLAMSRLPPHERAHFSQAVVSQIEHGVLQLVNKADPRISVLMDCEGLSPIRFPMQMLKSCATILQDHYPNRLAVLFVVRLPPVSRVITQAFMKVLRPATRQKLRIEGQAYHKILSDFFQSVPAFLGGNCTCPKCGMLLAGKTRDQTMEEVLREQIAEGQPRTHRPWKKIIVIVEGIYSMEGELCKLPEIIAVCKKYKAYTYLDEAHSIGAVGKTGRGVCELLGVDPADVDIMMGTFTKSFGSCGGYIAASKEIVKYLKHTCPAHLYATSMSPPAVQQVISAIKVILGEDGSNRGALKLAQIRENSNFFRSELQKMGFEVLGDNDSPVMPIMVYNPAKIPAFSRECLRQKVAVVSVGFPATPLLLARVRICISASHSREDLAEALEVISKVGDLVGIKYFPVEPQKTDVEENKKLQ